MLLHSSDDLRNSPVISSSIAYNAEIVGNYFSQKMIDVRLCILARAVALHELVELGELGLGEAFDRLVETVERASPAAGAPKPATKPRPTPKRAPQTTFDAIVSSCGRTALRVSKMALLSPAVLSSTDQTRELIARLIRFRPSYSAITDDLLFE